jgi:hypothetical protein
MLSSDELGRKGEAHFRLVCADVGLICNPSTEDRRGWDFIVEFPFDLNAGNVSLDKRLTPISSHIQVKTIYTRNDRVRLRLTAAEWLAKETKPSFIYVLKIDPESLEPTGAWLIHIFDDAMAKILQRLRKAQADGISKVNHIYVSFSASREGIPISPTGPGLKIALKELCGLQQRQYVDAKAIQIERLGFELRPFSFEFLLENLSESDLADVFLGRTRVAVSSIKMAETRFGIKLPLGDGNAKDGFVEIRPEAADKCKILVRRGGKLETIATFEGEVFVPSLPRLRKENFKFIIKNKFFEFLLGIIPLTQVN